MLDSNLAGPARPSIYFCYVKEINAPSSSLIEIGGRTNCKTRLAAVR